MKFQNQTIKKYKSDRDYIRVERDLIMLMAGAVINAVIIKLFFLVK